MRRKLLLLLSSVALLFGVTNAQTGPIKGTVKNNKGIAIPAATVKIKSSNKGTQTDDGGNFTISVEPGKTLTITAVGYAPKEVKAQDNIQIVLSEKDASLTEVVVTANAIKRDQRSLGYAAPTIKAAELTSGQSSSAFSSLAGRVAGLNITSTTGAPGGSTNIVLRGGSSITGNNQALIVVDGVPYNNSDNYGGGSLTAINFGNRGNDINPNDIASVTVLQGPGAAALYGARASNGALIITTKSGTSNKKAEVTFNSSNTWSRVLKLPDFQNQYGQGYYTGVNPDGTLAYNTQDWGDNFSWGAPFNGKVLPWGQQIDGVQLTKPYSADPDNVKHFFRTGFTSDNNIGLTSGNEKSSYYLGLNSLNSKGIYPVDINGYNKYSVRFNGKANLSNNFYTSINFNYVKIHSNPAAGGQGANSILTNLYATPRDIPIDKMSNLNNKYYGYGYTDASGVYHPNQYGFYNEFYPSPWFTMQNFNNIDDVDRVTGGFNLGYKATPWLDVLERLTTDYSNDRRRFQGAKYNFSPADPGTNPSPASPAYPSNAIVRNGGTYEEDTYTFGEINHDLMVTGKHDLGNDFSASLMVGNNVRINNNTITVTSTNQSSGLTVPGWYNFGNSNGPVYATNYHSTQRRVSLYGDLELSYKSILYIGATARNDWSSTLPTNNNSFFYSSVNGSFIFTDLLKGSEISRILNYGKLRANWAQVGNDAGPYQLSTLYSQASIGNGYGTSTTFPFSGVPGFMINGTLGDPGLQPEITTAREVGTDLGFLNNRIYINATYYNNRSKNQIISSYVAPSSGYTNSIVNSGVVQNKGVELTLRGTPIKTRTFELELFGTYTKNNNKVLALPGHAQIQVGGFNGMAIVAQEGMPYGEFYAVNTQSENGHTIVGKDGIPLQTTTAQYLGSYNPKYMASFGGNLKYNGWHLGFLFETKQGGVYFSNTKGITDFNGTSLETGGIRDPQIWAGSVINTGTSTQPIYTPNTTAKYVKQDYYANFEPAGQNVVDASFIKLRSLQLDYDLPANLLGKTPFGHASIGLFGNNLFIWTPKSNQFVDPEMNSTGAGNQQGFDFVAQPSLRNYGVNLKVTF